MSIRRVLFALVTIAPLAISTAARAEVKFGYVDLQRALKEIEEGRQAKAKLQSMLEAKQKEIDKEQEGIRKEAEMLEKQSSAMSQETLMAKRTELQRKAAELAQRYQKGQAEMQNTERTELQGIFQKMDPIIKDIAEREGFTMVFEKTDSGIVYAPSSLDLTNELIRLYNDQHKKGAVERKTTSNTTPKK